MMSRMGDYMRNSAFFKEAAIVANYALKRKYPLEAIGYGINHLKYIRMGRFGSNFNGEVFNKFVPHYEICARDMILAYMNYR